MASRCEVEVTVVSAHDLKNVNWKHGDLMPYAALWVDPSSKCSTKVAAGGDDDDPVWDEKLVIPLPGHDLRDAVLHIDVVHANAAEDVKPLVGSARLPLGEVVDEIGIGGNLTRKLKLRRPSGRPHGKLEVKACVRESPRFYESVPYGAPYVQQQRDPYGHYPYGYAAPPPVGYSYAAPPGGYAYAAPPPPGGYAYGSPPPSGYPYGGAAPPPPVPMYGQAGPSYGSAPPPVVDQRKSKFGMGTGLAVGAAAGVVGGLALAEGVDYVEDKIAEDVAERVEECLGFDDGDF